MVPDTTGPTVRIAKAVNQFALDLYARLRVGVGNLFCSPFSISTCLAMAYAGARGETERQMARVLGFPPDQAQVHESLGALIQDLNARTEQGDYQLLVANALWGQQGYLFFRPFVELLRSKYGGELQELDFANDADLARRTINAWVEGKTQDKIRDLIPPGGLAGLTRLVLTNAIYFKGRWQSPFFSGATKPEPFKSGAGDPVEVPMMRDTATFMYREEHDFQVLELVYQGGDLSMVIFLPREVDGLEGFEQSLTSANLTTWLSKLQLREVRLFLPKFRMTVGFLLGGTLRSMGMVDAFALETADFSGITDEKGVGISEVIHKAFVEVNEEGTEAAAATAIDSVDILVRDFEPPPPAVFRADHPFLFLIRDHRSDSVLFMGRLSDPATLE